MSQRARRIRVNILMDGHLKHECRLRDWASFDARFTRRSEEWVCPRCGQVWIALTDHPHHELKYGDWKKLRAGFWRRPVRRPVEVDDE